MSSDRAGTPKRRPSSVARAFVAAGLLLLVAGPPAAAQEASAIGLPGGDTITFHLDTLRQWMTDARRLEDLLERDPRVVYYTGTGPPATSARPGPAYPWIAVHVRSDSAVTVTTPSNLREMARAYANYAVDKMLAVRHEGPATDCDDVVSRELMRFSSFLDGWIVSRTLYGGPPFPPVDALVFARAAGHLPAMLVDLGDSELVGCRDGWEKAHPDRVNAYRDWRHSALSGLAADSVAAADSAARADSVAAANPVPSKADTATLPDTTPGPSPRFGSGAGGG